MKSLRLWLLGRAADGSMRDAMSLADQAIAFGSGKLQEADVRNMLGTIDQTARYTTLSSRPWLPPMAAKYWPGLSSYRSMPRIMRAALEELLTLLHRIAIAQAIPDVSPPITVLATVTKLRRIGGAVGGGGCAAVLSTGFKWPPGFAPGAGPAQWF